MIIPIAIIITIASTLLIFSEEIDDYMDANDDTNWINSGPFSIDREEYLIGHKIFLIANGINVNEKGIIQLVKINQDGTEKIIKKYPFNGINKSNFNIYFTPNLKSSLEICSVEDIVGNYKMVFVGTEYDSIEIEIKNKFLPGAEILFEPIC